MKNIVGLSAPWVTYYREIEALFGADPEITVAYDELQGEIKMLVNNDDKAQAIAQILPAEKTFGGVTIKVTIVTANSFKPANINMFERALEGNPAVSFMETVDGVFSNPISYIVFANKVVQFFDDNLGDINGMRSTLYEDIASNIFAEHEGICFCTDLPKNELYELSEKEAS